MTRKNNIIEFAPYLARQYEKTQTQQAIELEKAILQSAKMQTLTPLTEHFLMRHIPILVSQETEIVYRALWALLQRKHFALFEALLLQGLDINIISPEHGGRTFLMSTSVVGDDEMLDFLLSHGADVMARCYKGFRAIDYAEYLDKRGASCKLAAVEIQDSLDLQQKSQKKALPALSLVVSKS